MSDGAGSVAVQANARIDDLVDRLKALEDRVAELERAVDLIDRYSVKRVGA